MNPFQNLNPFRSLNVFKSEDATLDELIKNPDQVDSYAAVIALGDKLDRAARKLEANGAELFEKLQSVPVHQVAARAIIALVQHAPAGKADDKTTQLVRSLFSNLSDPDSKRWALENMAERRPELFFPEWAEQLASSSKGLRKLAVGVLITTHRGQALALGRRLLESKQADARLGAVALLGRLATAEALQALQVAHAMEKSRPVSAALEAELAKHGIPFASESVPGGKQTEGGDPWAALAAEAANLERKSRWAAGWCDPGALPALHRRGGERVETVLLTELLARQAAHKEMAPSPVVARLIASLDRSRSGDFAHALLAAWLASPQEAKDRWALVLAGALGDARILPVLNSWIPRWCEAGRGKLAEYAAQAIALQASDEALMLLDALANRYRNKQRNIGAAATAAFETAATARGVSVDELGDIVAPRFGFDAEGRREFAWEGGAARAELGVDLKLQWSDPATDKPMKGLPAAAPEELKTEVKTLGKLLREAAKAQAARLELALVRQRRWPVARWRELYENHPLLRAFATRLVWGVYAADGERRRCFRRYPNGLLADAEGGLEELPETDAFVGIVHPLELSAESVAAWRAHLERFRVEPPFPQLERAVERLDPVHANRRELAVAQGREVSAGTFRSRAERRGWARGSVVDAGGVSGYFKTFPGAGVEVTLELDGLYVGIDPMDTVTLGIARFARADTVKRGSYVYDDPQAGDARVLPFGAVPPVVYSEVVGDLKAIAGLVASGEAEDGA